MACRPVPLPPSSEVLGGQPVVVPQSFELVWLFENRRSEPWAPLQRPSAVSVQGDGRFFFADLGSGRVHRFDADGFFVDELGAEDGLLPLDLASHGFLLYVLDERERRVLRYTENGVFRDVLLDLTRLERRGRIEPSAMAIDRDGRIAVADVSNHQVLLVGPFLELETTVGEYGSFESQFQDPRGVCFGVEGVLYVSDRGNRRVQAFDRTGFLLASTNSVDDVEPLLVAPSGMATDDHGNVYVCDTAAGEVLVFAPDLTLIARLGGDDLSDGRLDRPVDCAVGPQNLLYVVDAGRDALAVFEIFYP